MKQEYGIETLRLAMYPAPSAHRFEAGGPDSVKRAVVSAYAAATTTSLTLMTNLYVVPFRNPSPRQSIAPFDILSGGRLLLEVGAGIYNRSYPRGGVDSVDRAALFDEGVNALRRVRHPLRYAVRDLVSNVPPTRSRCRRTPRRRTCPIRCRSRDTSSAWMNSARPM